MSIQSTLRFRLPSPEEICAGLPLADKRMGTAVEGHRAQLRSALQCVYNDCADIVDETTKQEIANILCDLDRSSPVEIGKRINALKLNPKKQRNGGPGNALKNLGDACEFGDAVRAQTTAGSADKQAGMMYNKLDMQPRPQSTGDQLSLPFDAAEEKRRHWEALRVIIRFYEDQDLLIATLESEGLTTRDSLEAQYNEYCHSSDSGGESMRIKTFEQFIEDERTYFARVVEYLIEGEAQTVEEAIDKKREDSSNRLRLIMESLRNKPR